MRRQHACDRRRAQRVAHVIARLAERYGLDVTPADVDEMLAHLDRAQHTAVRLHRELCLVRLPWGGRTLYLIYDIGAQMYRTALAPDDAERIIALNARGDPRTYAELLAMFDGSDDDDA